MQRSFSEDPSLSEQLFDLLDTVFPGVRQVAQNARALGASWESVSTPFIHFERGRAVSHVGVIELSLVLLGGLVRVGSIHGVATHPDARRRGHYGRLMERVLDYGAGRYETLILTTEHPEYFAPFGFRVVQEHRFTVRCDCAGRHDGFRVLDPRRPSDVAALHRLLETREPVSRIVGVVDEKAVFCFNEGSRPLHYSADLDAIVCLEMDDGRLTVFDIVAPEIPPLDRVLDSIARRVDEVTICFGADRLSADAKAEPYVLDHDGPSYFMVRGPFAAEHLAFTLPRSART
jgi:predicted N-acetyltransferase YhbS